MQTSKHHKTLTTKRCHYQKDVTTSRWQDKGTNRQSITSEACVETEVEHKLKNAHQGVLFWLFDGPASKPAAAAAWSSQHLRAVQPSAHAAKASQTPLLLLNMYTYVHCTAPPAIDLYRIGDQNEASLQQRHLHHSGSEAVSTL